MFLVVNYHTDRGSLAKWYSDITSDNSRERMCSTSGVISEGFASGCSWVRSIRSWETVRTGSGALLCQLIRLAVLRAPECVYELALCLGMWIYETRRRG